MQISKSSWLYRLFRWTHISWQMFLCNDESFRFRINTDEEIKTNVCHFVRTLLLYLPILVILNGSLFLVLLGAIITLLCGLVIGLSDFPWISLFGIIVIFLASVGVYYLVRFLLTKGFQWYENLVINRFIEKTEKPVTSIFALGKQWLADKYGKYCTNIEFVEKE